jgi:hypothetical protein
VIIGNCHLVDELRVGVKTASSVGALAHGRAIIFGKIGREAAGPYRLLRRPSSDAMG